MKSSTELLLGRCTRSVMAPGEDLGYRVPAGRGPRPAAQQPAHREISPAGSAVPGQCFLRVGTAAGVEPAAGRQEGGDRLAIEAHREQKNPRDRARPRHRCRAALIRSCFAHTDGPSSREGGSLRVPPEERGTRPSRRNAESRSEPSSALVAVAAAGRARTTNELPPGSVPSRADTR